MDLVIPEHLTEEGAIVGPLLQLCHQRPCAFRGHAANLGLHRVPLTHLLLALRCPPVHKFVHARLPRRRSLDGCWTARGRNHEDSTGADGREQRPPSNQSYRNRFTAKHRLNLQLTYILKFHDGVHAPGVA
jgi:hypothetical protein